MIDLFITSRADWRNDAACRPWDGIDADLANSFFPAANPVFDADGQHSKQFVAQAQAALAVCARCPVRKDCLQAQLGMRNDEHAIAGGTLPGQRAILRKQLAALHAEQTAEGDAAEAGPQPAFAA